MRIISGLLKGRRIIAPKKLPVRPTTDRSKEALFNILNNGYDFSEIRILDLFSGTGNISYEFGSRGVDDIVAVDRNKHCTRFIKETSNKDEKIRNSVGNCFISPKVIVSKIASSNIARMAGSKNESINHRPYVI